jgi:hypothetical protein
LRHETRSSSGMFDDSEQSMVSPIILLTHIIKIP